MFFDISYTLIIAISAFVFSLVGCYLAQVVLQLTDTHDIPNERSNHQQPVPRGGGLGVMFALLGFMLISGAPAALLWAALGLAVISFMDDRGGVPIRQRLLVQIAGVALTIMALEGPVFQGLLPIWADHFLAGIILLAVVNLTNFMDGIDGISGAHVASIGFGFMAVGLAADGIGKGIAVDGALLAAVAAGFLVLNWHPAKLFLGDVGSIPLGLITGFLLLQVAASGYWEAALILPAYYLVDSGVTFCKRLLNKEKVWVAHSQHAYQQAVRRGWPHDAVVMRMAEFNLFIILLAVLATREMLSIWMVPLAYAGAFWLRHHLLTAPCPLVYRTRAAAEAEARPAPAAVIEGEFEEITEVVAPAQALVVAADAHQAAIAELAAAEAELEETAQAAQNTARRAATAPAKPKTSAASAKKSDATPRPRKTTAKTPS